MGYPLSTPPSRAPRWVGSTSDEYITYFMASSKPSKRPYSDSDSDSEPLPSTFPHFIVLESLDKKQLTKLNPIIIEKTISGIVNPISVKKLNNGTLLIEVDKKDENFCRPQNQSFSTSLSLNSSKGVVRSSELSLSARWTRSNLISNRKVFQMSNAFLSKEMTKSSIQTHIYFHSADPNYQRKLKSATTSSRSIHTSPTRYVVTIARSLDIMKPSVLNKLYVKSAERVVRTTSNLPAPIQSYGC